jgi:hypothetical protein
VLLGKGNLYYKACSILKQINIDQFSHIDNRNRPKRNLHNKPFPANSLDSLIKRAVLQMDSIEKGVDSHFKPQFVHLAKEMLDSIGIQGGMEYHEFGACWEKISRDVARCEPVYNL